jgi:hypothetical protein
MNPEETLSTLEGRASADAPKGVRRPKCFAVAFGLTVHVAQDGYRYETDDAELTRQEALVWIRDRVERR